MNSTSYLAWAGIDVSKRSLDVTLLDQSGQYRHRKFANTPTGWREFLDWIRIDHSQVHFVMESTGPYSYGPAAFLADQKLAVTVENPLFIKRWAEGCRIQNKTDKADSRVIARYAKERQPRLWELSEPILREIHLLLGRLTDLEKMKTAERNRLENQTLPDAVVQSIQGMIRFFEAEQDQLASAISALLAMRPDLSAMVAALVREPGVGELTALRVLSHFGWSCRFESAQNAAASVGLNPVRFESGSMHKRTRISKRGPAELRGNLFMATVAAITHNPRIKAFYDRLIERGMRKKAALIACSRKLVMILYGILKAFLTGNPITYSKPKARYVDIRGRQRLFPKEISPTPLTI